MHHALAIRVRSGAERTVVYEEAALVDSQKTRSLLLLAEARAILLLKYIVGTETNKSPLFVDLLSSPKGRVCDLADFDEDSRRAEEKVDGTSG